MKNIEYIYLGLALLCLFLSVLSLVLYKAYKDAERERLALILKNEELKLLLRLIDK